MLWHGKRSDLLGIRFDFVGNSFLHLPDFFKKTTLLKKFYIDPDIRIAETLPADFYQSQSVFEQIKTQIFERSWHWIGDSNSILPLNESVYPFVLLEYYLKEPLLLIRKSHQNILCLSNVCTHRGNLIINHPGKVKQLICGYHGRRFGLDGTFKSMPEFKEAENFPRPCDHLHSFPVTNWDGHLFVSLNPAFEFSNMITQMNERIGFLPLNEFKSDPTRSKDYLINCHWALYCDNYLEGFHIPFVHEDLNQVLDFGDYTTQLYEKMVLQIGYGKGSEETFDLPEGHPDFGKKVSAYYYWIFPNMMFNFYPWGLSINIVKPISQNKTKVSFISYVYDESKLDLGAGALLDKVEREDEFVVESVHRGLQSKFYQKGRFSPNYEKGVHHFHRLLAGLLDIH